MTKTSSPYFDNYLHIFHRNQFVMQVFTIIVLAICIFPQCVLSANLDDLDDGVMTNIWDNLDPISNVNVKLTSKRMNANIILTPKDHKVVFEDYVNRAHENGKTFYEISKKIVRMKDAHPFVNDFITVKSPDTTTPDEIGYTLLILSHYVREMEHKSERSRKNMHQSMLYVQAYANYNKYTHRKIVQCTIDAYEKIKAECLQDDDLRKSCSVYSSMCGLHYDVFRNKNVRTIATTIQSQN